MTFVIITHVPHKFVQQQYFAYGPYVNEMNIWGNHVSHLHIVATLSQDSVSVIDVPYLHDSVFFQPVEAFSLISFKHIIQAIFKIPKISASIFKAMQQADHIHLRCPGNMGLLGAIIQIAFPKTQKTAKYAGNWDPKAKQPWSYRLQKWILSNTFLTRNIHVLVYGDWKGCSKNIKPFFTATYSEKDKTDLDCLQTNRLTMLRLSEIRLLFVGTLSKGKQPLYAIQLVEKLHQQGYSVCLDLFGEGVERQQLESYLLEKDLQNRIVLHGNQTKETIQLAYQSSHFLILPSKSEGWPKVVAEAMFWGCVPLATAVSCVSTMLANGDRGLLLSMDTENDSTQIQNTVVDASIFLSKSTKAAQWSRLYTLDYFETEIKKLVHGVMSLKTKSS